MPYGATAEMGERATAELQPLTHQSEVEVEVESEVDRHASESESEGFSRVSRGGKVAAFVLLSGAMVSMVAMPSVFEGQTRDVEDHAAVDLSWMNGYATSKPSYDLSYATLKASNEYTQDYGFAGEEYDWLESGSLVEPNKQTTLTATLPSGLNPSSVHMYWQAGSDVTSSGKLEAAVSDDGTGWQLTTVFPVPGQYTVEMMVGHSSGETSSVNLPLTCRYVRRELRSLTHDDRNRYFDAAKALVELDKDPTIAAATNWTRGVAYYVRKHLRNAIANKRSDRMHDGMGFLSQHMAITSDYERALQAMDPQVSMPYWDYTIDGAKYNKSGWEQTSLWDSDLWTPGWFGNATGASHVVEEGRWAYQEVSTDDDPDSKASNPYGYLRAPWNLNPSKYVTRFHELCGVYYDQYKNWPNCALHHSALTEMNTYSTFIPFMAYAAHAGVHMMVGGSSRCHNWLDEFVDAAGIDAIETIAWQSPFMLRDAWRMGLCETPEYCSSDSSEDCKFTCKGCDSDSFSESQMYGYTQASFWSKSTSLYNSEVREQLVRGIYCSDDQWILGDHIEGSSPADVSFWPIHPTLERLTVYKNIKVPFTDTTWYSSESLWNGYCKWGETFARDLPGNNTMDNDYCSGHYEDDLTAFEVAVPANALTGATLEEGPLDVVSRQLSNGAIMELLRPENTMYLPYVYDSFTWNHCEELGFDFKDVASQ